MVDPKDFARLFEGRRDAYGLRHGESVRESVTAKTYGRHLDGGHAIGIFPVLKGECRFACVDYDRLKDNIPPDEAFALAKQDALRTGEQLSSLGLNRWYLERSKGKGAHLWVFFDDWVSCADIRRVLAYALSKAAVDLFELFPKQDEVDEKGGKLGNYINLPYPGDDDAGKQMMFSAAYPHAAITLDAFMREVERHSADDLAAALGEVPEEVASRSFSKVQTGGRRATWYPCTTPLLDISLAEGDGRNELGFEIAKRLHASPIGPSSRPVFDDWNEANRPPMAEHEASKVWGQGAQYSSMGCEKIRSWSGSKSEAIRASCGAECPIHPNRGGAVKYHRLRKMTYEPPVYVMSISGEDVRLTLDQIWSHDQVRKQIAAQTDRVVPSMKSDQWRDQFQALLDDVEVIRIPEDATERGEAWAAVCGFVQNYSDDMADLERSRPVADKTHMYVRGPALRTLLKRRGTDVKISLLFEVIRAHGGYAKSVRAGDDGSILKVWALPLEELPI